MNIIENHKKLYTQKYVDRITKLCRDFFEKHLDKTPTYEEIQAFTYGHLCGKNQANNIDEFHKIK